MTSKNYIFVHFIFNLLVTEYLVCSQDYYRLWGVKSKDLKICPYVDYREIEQEKWWNNIPEKGRLEEMYFTIRGMNPECWSVYRGEEHRTYMPTKINFKKVITDEQGLNSSILPCL